eukprot:390353_1
MAHDYVQLATIEPVLSSKAPTKTPPEGPHLQSFHTTPNNMAPFETSVGEFEYSTDLHPLYLFLYNVIGPSIAIASAGAFECLFSDEFPTIRSTHYIFPSLGPTAFLLFARPQLSFSSP